MIAIGGVIITEKMTDAGVKICDQAMVVHCRKQLKEKIDWSIHGPNGDLLKKYSEGDLTTVDLIYLAMERAK